ncbi:MAG: PTS sugar transporter subunit IIA [Elusimicrobiota bacterium]
MTPEMDISVSDIINCDNIAIENKGFDNLDLLIKFSLDKIYPLISKSITLKSLNEKISKAKSFYTVFENGLFLPHLKLDDINNFKAQLVITPKAVKDPRVEYEIYVTFMLFSPISPAFFEKHLKILSSITQMFRDSIPKVINMKSPQEVYSYIKSFK